MDPDGPAASEHGETGLPWEERHETGLLAALVRTVRLIALSPVTAFARVRPARGLSEPLLFGLIVAATGIALNILGALVFGSVAALELPDGVNPLQLRVGDLSLDWVPMLAAVVGGSLVGMIVAAVVFPPLFLAAIFLWSGALHGALRGIGGLAQSVGGFAGTFAVAGYSSVGFLVHVVPAVGDLIGSIWVVVLHVIGLAAVHKTGKGRALVATLLPIALAALLAVVLLSLTES